MASISKIEAQQSSTQESTSSKSECSDFFKAHLQDPLNFRDPQVLSNYVDPEFRDKVHLEKAQAIAVRIFETYPRQVRGTSDRGLSYPMNPEVLAYAMQQARGEIVLEIAGAHGENAILLAFGGAEQVYLNDIETINITQFKKLKKNLPPDVRQKLDSIKGDCFDLLKKKPEMTNKLGLILCRNLIHFFSDQQQTEFFQLLNQMLKPGGRAIFTVSSIYGLPALRSHFDKNPDSTCFKVSQCFLYNRQQNSTPCATLLQSSIADPEYPNFTSYKEYYLYEREKGKSWQANHNNFNELESSLRPEIQQVIKFNKPKMKQIKVGAVKVLENDFRLYRETTLTELFKRHGFEVESTFLAKDNGHLASDDNQSESKPLMGIMVKKPTS